jgi:hypothetical protein
MHGIRGIKKACLTFVGVNGWRQVKYSLFKVAFEPLKLNSSRL